MHTTIGLIMMDMPLLYDCTRLVRARVWLGLVRINLMYVYSEAQPRFLLDLAHAVF